jgi:hypothetical protein
VGVTEHRVLAVLETLIQAVVEVVEVKLAEIEQAVQAEVALLLFDIEHRQLVKHSIKAVRGFVQRV